MNDKVVVAAVEQMANQKSKNERDLEKANERIAELERLNEQCKARVLMSMSEEIEYEKRIEELENKLDAMVCPSDYNELKAFKIGVEKYLKDLDNSNANLNSKIGQLAVEIASNRANQSVSKTELLASLVDERARVRATRSELRTSIRNAGGTINSDGFKGGKKPERETEDYDFIRITF